MCRTRFSSWDLARATRIRTSAESITDGAGFWHTAPCRGNRPSLGPPNATNRGSVEVAERAELLAQRRVGALGARRRRSGFAPARKELDPRSALRRGRVPVVAP